MKNIRVRFAPSPTGSLHIGGVRTLLYNYLLAKKYAGKFIIRIEDTDRTRFVKGAEEYIRKTLDWLQITPDESPWYGGDFGPYRQSERLQNYREVAHNLVAEGKAYYAFDSVEELEKMRNDPNGTRKYDAQTRLKMHNSLTLTEARVQELLAEKQPYVIRLLTPKDKGIEAEDLLRGTLHFAPDVWEDKVLLKQDGFPTYHLAAIVDDLQMEISHVLRGEEWLPSLPVHILLWHYLGKADKMPKWIHLPLLLRPEGAGKLSKRDGIALGFPVLPLATENPPMQGFKEEGFLPDALINALVVSAWNAGDERQIFSRAELIQDFSLQGLQYQSVKFDIDKTRWINLQHLRLLSDTTLQDLLVQELAKRGIFSDYMPAQILEIVKQTRERYTSLVDIWANVVYFFQTPLNFDFTSLKVQDLPNIIGIFREFVQALQNKDGAVDEQFCRDFFAEDLLTRWQLKMGTVQLALRLALVGEKKGIGVFAIISLLPKIELIKRIEIAISEIAKLQSQ